MEKGFATIGSLIVVGAAIVGVTGLSASAAEPEPLTPREYLREQCQSPDCDFLLLDTIIDCESGWQMVKNRRSSAYGYFQILDSTEATTPQYKGGLRKHDPYINLDMGLYLYETRGSNPWNASKGCWAPKYNYKRGLAEEECVGECN